MSKIEIFKWFDLVSIWLWKKFYWSEPFVLITNDEPEASPAPFLPHIGQFGGGRPLMRIKLTWLIRCFCGQEWRNGQRRARLWGSIERVRAGRTGLGLSWSMNAVYAAGSLRFLYRMSGLLSFQWRRRCVIELPRVSCNDAWQPSDRHPSFNYRNFLQNKLGKSVGTTT